MQNMSKWFLHSRMGNSFHFKHVDHPEEITCSFTITYIDDGYTVLTGDMGCLTWCRYRGLDYGFPGKDTNIGYFSEKVVKENGQTVIIWDKEKAIEDIQKYMDELWSEQDEESHKRVRELTGMLECETWEENKNIPDVGRYQMLNALNRISYGDWYENGFGDRFDPNFTRKFEMVKSVSEMILESVKRDA